MTTKEVTLTTWFTIEVIERRGDSIVLLLDGQEYEIEIEGAKRLACALLDCSE